MVTELSIQQCSAKFLNSEEFWKNALMWNRIWKNEDFYFDENNIDGLPIELPRCLHTPQQHLKAPRMNWAFIWRQAGQLISAMGWHCVHSPIHFSQGTIWGLTKEKVAAMANACVAFNSSKVTKSHKEWTTLKRKRRKILMWKAALMLDDWDTQVKSSELVTEEVI